MDVRLPNGKIIKGVPEGTPKDEIKRKAIAAGIAAEADFGMASRDAAPAPDQPAPAQADTNLTGRPLSYSEAQPPIEGLGDILPRVGTAAKLAIQEATSFDEERMMNALRESYPGVKFERDAEGRAIADFTEIGGQRGYLNVPGADMRDVAQAGMAAVQYGPAGRIAGAGKSLAGQAFRGAGASAATEAARDVTSQAAGGTEEVSAGNLDGWNISAAGGMGAAAPYAARAVEGAVRRIAGRGIPVLREDGGLTDEALDALRQARTSTGELDRTVAQRLQQQGVLTPEQAETFNLFRSQGVSPTRANLTQTADDWQLQQEGIKRSGTMRSAVDQQDAALARRGEELVERTGGQTSSQMDTGEQVFNAVTRKATDLDSRISQLYRDAYSRVSDEPAIAMNRTVNALRRNAGMNQRSNGTVTAIQSALRGSGVLGRGFTQAGRMAPRRVGVSSEKVFEPNQISVRQAEKIRQDLNDLYSGANDQGRRIINQVKDSLDEDVFSTVGEDIFAQARKAKADFHREMARVRSSKFDKNTQSVIEDVLENKIAPERMFEKLVVNKSTRTSDLKALRDYLRSGTEEQVQQGTQAWNALRAEAIRHMVGKATGTAGRTEGGGAVFNGNQFRKAMDQIGGERLRTLFGPDELKDLGALRKIGELRIPVSMTQQGKGPSAQAVAEVVDSIPLGEALRRITGFRGAVQEGRAINQAVNPIGPTERALRRPPITPEGAQQAGQFVRSLWEL